MNGRMNGLDLFSGIGGIALALQRYVKTLAYCEIDEYARRVLEARMKHGQIDSAPIWGDVRTLKGGMFTEGSIDIITGGFPCQDVSTAGLRKGLEGQRTGLFREAIRLVRECRPKFVFLENVPGIRKYVHVVRGELEAIGYDCRDGFLSAAEIGAPHQRNRWWLLAHSNSGRPHEKQECFEERRDPIVPRWNGQEEPVAHTKSVRLETSRTESREPQKADAEAAFARAPDSDCGFGIHRGWATEPVVGRVAHGVPHRVDRLRCLGNAVVPQCAEAAFCALMGIGRAAA